VTGREFERLSDAAKDVNMVLVKGDGYEVIEWSSQEDDGPEYRAEQVHLMFSLRIGNSEIVPVVRLKSRRAITELIDALTQHRDSVWNEDGTLAGPKDAKPAGVKSAQPGEAMSCLATQAVVKTGVSNGIPTLRLVADCAEQQFAIDFPSSISLMVLLTQMVEAGEQVWPEDGEPKTYN